VPSNLLVIEDSGACGGLLTDTGYNFVIE
jgi:hypothetical protein